MKLLGQIGEEIACRYLEKTGYKICERNYKKSWGEIDVIAQKDQKIIFFEVKCLKSKQILPEHQMTRSKIKKILKVAQFYINSKYPGKEWQVDLIAIEFSEKDRCKLRHIKNIGLN